MGMKMKRRKPHQHIRKLKSGKRVLINKGVRKKKNFGMASQIYLYPRKIRGSFKDSSVRAFTHDFADDAIFLVDLPTENPKEIAKIIEHEELHKELGKINPKASSGLDVLTPLSWGFRFRDPRKKEIILNPKTSWTIFPSKQKALLSFLKEVNLKLHKLEMEGKIAKGKGEKAMDMLLKARKNFTKAIDQRTERTSSSIKKWQK